MRKSKECKTERFNLFLSPSESQAIDEWAWANRLRSKSEAVRQLLEIGLASESNLAALVKAEEFIRGFEDDEMQEGITDLLAKLRSAITAAGGDAK